MEAKDALELYESGKHRRYGLLFAVNGGAFAVARLLAGPQQNVLGGLTLRHLSAGMMVFTVMMVADIFAFGIKMRDEPALKEPPREVFGAVGMLVLLVVGAVVCAGWWLAGFH